MIFVKTNGPIINRYILFHSLPSISIPLFSNLIVYDTKSSDPFCLISILEEKGLSFVACLHWNHFQTYFAFFSSSLNLYHYISPYSYFTSLILYPLPISPFTLSSFPWVSISIILPLLPPRISISVPMARFTVQLLWNCKWFGFFSKWWTRFLLELVLKILAVLNNKRDHDSI